ncbi:YchJ family metal-binding protein [Mycolicibacterium hippocampi]
MRSDSPCPCGSGDPFGRCCLPLHTGDREAQTAEQLMRSRYTAFATGDVDYLWRTWHPRTRPDRVDDAGLIWTGLHIIDCVAGGPGDQTGEVEFRARYLDSQRTGTLHERSRFAVRARRWFYLDGELFS